jgi:hypothetical protein
LIFLSKKVTNIIIFGVVMFAREVPLDIEVLMDLNDPYEVEV